MAEAIKYGFYAVNPDYLEYLNQIDSEVYTTYHIGTVFRKSSSRLLSDKQAIFLIALHLHIFYEWHHKSSL